ncbi:hypothetical protein GCM10012287_02340 [Streptomyces daqingensis]|uniref:Uncharacterized protein n=1 Tax=Streptomyces daqingensis TaxID=1472640 RepID=A0ABQ2LR12_9ACTN|nr:hypothetical protein GCM10012287_02340 [Streptomyces daqingensis]
MAVADSKPESPLLAEWFFPSAFMRRLRQQAAQRACRHDAVEISPGLSHRGKQIGPDCLPFGHAKSGITRDSDMWEVPNAFYGAEDCWSRLLSRACKQQAARCGAFLRST